jgi:hypothetical protein
MNQRWLEYEGMTYSQKEGLFIGNPLSPILAEVFMGNMEKRIKNKSWFPRVWCRYVDDIMAVVMNGEETRILSELNKQHEAIKFTIEVEESNSLPFLDLKITRSEGNLVFDIFRKPTDAPLCIPYASHHPWTHKVAAFESALYRMWNLPISESNRRKELAYILKMAEINGYKEEMIRKMSRKHRMRKERKKITTLKPIKKEGKRNMIRHVSFPYHKHLTEKLGRKLKTCGLNVVYHSRGNLRSLIGKVKRNRPKMEKSGIYNINCGNCEGRYVGQTKRRVDTRFKEHVRALRLKQIGKSAIADHCLSKNHEMGECTVLKEIQNPTQLDAWESIFISKGQRLVNVDEAPISSKLFEFTSIEKDKLS